MAFEKESDLNRDYMLYTKGTEIYGIRKGDWKYLPHSGGRNADEKSAPELFNVKEDVAETTNLFEKQPEIVKRLSEEIVKFKK